MWEELGIAPCYDPKVIRHAYAVRLKTIDPDRDPAAFARLREALEWALVEAEEGAWSLPGMPADVRLPEPDLAQDWVNELVDLDFAQPPHDAEWFRERSPEPPAGGDDADAPAQWLDIDARERELVRALESALEMGDPGEAVKLYYRAAAIGLVSLQDAPAMLDRLFALALAEPRLDRAKFRELARTFEWDKPAHEFAVMSDLRQRVLARLAAEDWYDALVATAERRGGVTRKQAKLARFTLGWIGRLWRPRIDRAALKLNLDQYRTHEPWLRDRIDPAWVCKLEGWWRRREIAMLAFSLVFLTAMLIDLAYVTVRDAVVGTLPLWTIILVPLVAFLLWALKFVAVALYRLVRQPPSGADADIGPPVDPHARLRWLERQAESAYEAMYGAPAGAPFAARYNDAKEFFHDAIALARSLGDVAAAERLSRRLAEIKDIARTQFPAA